jgi:hypothetical protein
MNINHDWRITSGRLIKAAVLVGQAIIAGPIYCAAGLRGIMSSSMAAL